MLEFSAYEKIQENYVQKTTTTISFKGFQGFKGLYIQNSFVVYKMYKKYRIDLTKLNNQQRIVISIVNLMKLKLISGLHQQIKRECSTHIISNKMNKQSLIHI